jgi:hypothetical protein
MKKSKILVVVLIGLIMVSGLVLAGCDNEDDPGTGSKTDAARPLITIDPLDGVYLPGAAVTSLSVTASSSDGGTLSYQWYSETTKYSDGTAVAGATNASFTPPTTTAGTLYYYAEVTNTNNGVDGNKTAVQTSSRAKFVVGWEQLDGLRVEKNGLFYIFSARSIIFANNLFVAVGGNSVAGGGQIGWSNDGINWTMVENTTFDNSVINGIAYGNNRFIAVGEGGKMASSTDGKAWTTLGTIAAFGTSDISDIAYGNSRFFAVGNSTKSAYSTDNGSTWTSVDGTVGATNLFGNSGADISRIVYGKDRFVAYGYNNESKIPLYRNSIETSTWQGNPISAHGWTGTATISDLVFGNDYFIAVGNNGNVWKMDVSSGGYSWVKITTLPSGIGTDTISKAAYGSGKLLVFTSTRKGAWSSDNGATWTELPYVDMLRMAYGAGRFVAVSGGNGIFYSTYP